jgi:hypothetical protein
MLRRPQNGRPSNGAYWPVAPPPRLLEAPEQMSKASRCRRACCLVPDAPSRAKRQRSLSAESRLPVIEPREQCGACRDQDRQHHRGDARANQQQPDARETKHRELERHARRSREPAPGAWVPRTAPQARSRGLAPRSRTRRRSRRFPRSRPTRRTRRTRRAREGTSRPGSARAAFGSHHRVDGRSSRRRCAREPLVAQSGCDPRAAPSPQRSP